MIALLWPQNENRCAPGSFEKDPTARTLVIFSLDFAGKCSFQVVTPSSLNSVIPASWWSFDSIFPQCMTQSNWNLLYWT